MLAPPYGGMVASHPDRPDNRKACGNPVRTRQTQLVDADAKVPNRSGVIREYGRLAAGDAPAWTQMCHAARSTGAGGESSECARRPIVGDPDIQTRHAAALRDVRNVHGAQRGKDGVLDRSQDCRGNRGGRGGVGGILAVRSTDTITATPSAPNKRSALGLNRPSEKAAADRAVVVVF